MSMLSQQNQSDIRHLKTRNGHNLAYHSFNQDTVRKTNPGIIFLCGHGSDMNGTKALILEQLALDDWFAIVSRLIAGDCEAPDPRRSHLTSAGGWLVAARNDAHAGRGCPSACHPNLSDWSGLPGIR